MTELGNLYIVATPIGNLQDMTPRAVATLGQVDLIAAEDTRHTGKLLQHWQISTPQISYHEHNRFGRQASLLEQLQAGKSIALVTDAGTPAISDPGTELVQACVQAGIRVIPIPGVSAVTTALAVSGFKSDRFCFEGFLSPKAQERQAHLTQIAQEPRTLIFYAAPHHLPQTLEDLGQALGQERPLVIARELTKIYEEIWRGTIAQALEFYQAHTPRGEFTLVIAGYELSAPPIPEQTLKEQLQELLKEGMSKSQASRHLAELTGSSRRHLYQLALTLE
jgi:16S rRNA (cytidine1402-2'-O)-methyltransferase